MEMRKCMSGHYYDVSVHAECPYCNNNTSVGKTMALGVPAPVMSETSRTQSAMTNSAIMSSGGDGKTVALFQTEQGVDPVVGWLVCLNGKEKGRDYRIHSDNNYIGRSERMDVCIKGDDTISRENQAILTYDSKAKKYYLSPGEGRSILRLNDEAIFQTTEIKAYDKIVVGQTELLFVVLCGDTFSWEE